MSFKRSVERMAQVEARLRAGMAGRHRTRRQVIARHNHDILQVETPKPSDPVRRHHKVDPDSAIELIARGQRAVDVVSVRAQPMADDR